MAKSHHLLNLLQDHMTTAVVLFDEQPTTDEGYTYKVRKDWNLKAGDRLLVDSPRGGLKVVTVKVAHAAPKLDMDAKFAYKWAVQKVDTAFYNDQRARESLFLEQLAAVELAHQREKLLSKARANLGEDTEASRAFDSAVAALNA